jgi:hypothetical protein
LTFNYIDILPIDEPFCKERSMPRKPLVWKRRLSKAAELIHTAVFDILPVRIQEVVHPDTMDDQPPFVARLASQRSSFPTLAYNVDGFAALRH